MSSRLVRKWLRVGAVVCLGTALGLALSPGVAGASTPKKSGWWNLSPVSTTPTTSIPPPPPTTVPPTTVPPTTVPVTLPAGAGAAGGGAGGAGAATTAAAAAAATGSSLPAPAPTTLPGATPTTVPQATPKGELQVTFDGHSTTAFSAVEYTVPLSIGGQAVDPQSIEAILTLTLDTTHSAGTPKLNLCPTTSRWSGGGNQPAKKAPHFSCAGGHSSTGMYNSGSHTVTWDVSFPIESRTAPGTFSIAVIPSAKLTPADAFVATFDKPDKNSFVLLAWAPAPPKSTVPGPGGTGTTTTFPFGPPTPPPGGGSTSSPPAGSGSGSGSGSGGGGGQSGFGFGNPAGQGQSPPGGSPGSSPPQSPVGGGSPPSGGGGSPSHGSGLPLADLIPKAGGHGLSQQAQRNLAIGLLAALGVGLAAAGLRRTRQPRLLVPALARAPVPPT